MKKLLILAVSMLAAVATYGQGRVAFDNTGFLITTNVNGNTGVMSNSSGTYRFSVYFGAAGSTSNQLTAGQQFSQRSANPNTLPGRITTLSPAPLTAPFADGVNPTWPLAFQVRGWTATNAVGGFLSSYEQAYSYAQANPQELILLGASGIGSVTPTTGLTSPGVLFGVGPGLVGGFELAPLAVPEPSSIALGLLGLGAIALFRRRK